MGSARAGSNPVAVDIFIFRSVQILAYTFQPARKKCRAAAWPSGLRRQLQALVRKGVGSNPTAVNSFAMLRAQAFTALTLTNGGASAHGEKNHLGGQTFGEKRPPWGSNPRPPA